MHPRRTFGVLLSTGALGSGATILFFVLAREVPKAMHFRSRDAVVLPGLKVAASAMRLAREFALPGVAFVFLAAALNGLLWAMVAALLASTSTWRRRNRPHALNRHVL
jgi:hypothetical protein